MKHIIWHHSESNIGDVNIITGWHKERGFDTIGYQYVIDKLGEIQEGRTYYPGAHTKGKNEHMGICIVTNAELNEKQIEAVEKFKGHTYSFHWNYSEKLCPTPEATVQIIKALGPDNFVKV